MVGCGFGLDLYCCGCAIRMIISSMNIFIFFKAVNLRGTVSSDIGFVLCQVFYIFVLYFNACFTWNCRYCCNKKALPGWILEV